MPAFGENVGSAYVRIFADGSGMDAEIRESLNDAGKAYDDAGGEHGKRYQKSLKRELKSGPSKKSVQNAFDDQMARVKFGEKFFNGPSWKSFRDKMIAKNREVGEIAAAQLQKEFNEGLIDSKGLKARMANIDLLSTKTTEQIMKGEEESAKRLRKTQEAQATQGLAQDRRIANAHVAALAEQVRRDQAIFKDEERLGASHLGEMQRLRKLDISRQQAYAEQEKHIRKSVADLNEKASRSVAGDPEAPNRRRLLADLFAQRVALQKLGAGWEKERNQLRDQNHALVLTSPLLSRLNHTLNGTSESVGKAFGKGSRNDFLNFIGSVMGGIARLPATVVNAAGSFGRLRKAIALSIDDTFIRTGSKLLGTLAGLGTAAGQLGTAFAVGGGAILGLTGLIGPLIGLLSLAAGVVVALAGSIGFALVGAVGAAGAILFPFAAALGVVAVAFAGLSKAQKKALKVDFKPVTTELHKLREAAQDGIFKNMDKAAKNLAPAVKTLTPLFRQVGVAIGDVVVNLAKAANGPQFRQFVGAMTDYLPGAVRSLGKSLSSAFGGFGGIIRGMIPFMTQVLAGLEKITGKFNEWANSAGGQNSIKTFFTNALTSMKAFGGFLGSVLDLFGTLLSQGREAGDSIFGSMSKAIDGWTAKLKANPDILGDWFTSAKKFAGQVGNALVAIGHLFDSLDTAGSRKAITKVFEGMGKAINAIADAINSLPPGMGKRLLEVGAGLLIMSKALGFITKSAAALGIIRTIAATIGLIGPAAATSGAGLGIFAGGAEAAGLGAAGAAGGIAALAPALAAVAVAVAGGFATKYLVGLDKIDVAQGKVSDSMEELARTGKTSGFGDVSKSYGAAVPIINNLSRGLLHLKRPTQDIGEILHSAAFTDLPSIFAPGAVSAVKKMDGALAGMSHSEAEKAFVRITEDGKKAGLTIEDVRKLFPKYTAAANKWNASNDNAFQKSSDRLTAMATNIFQAGSAFKTLPKSVQIAIDTPGMVNSLADVDGLNKLFKLTPKKLVTTIAAAGLAETAADTKTVVDRYNLVPKDVNTLIKLSGNVDTLKEVNEYSKALNLTPTERTTLMKVLGIKEAVPGIRGLTEQLKGVPRETIMKIASKGADITTAEVRKIIEEGDNLSGKDIRAIIKTTGADITGAELTMLMGLADALNNKKPVIKVAADTKEQTATWLQIGADIRDMDHKKATPKVLLDNKEFVKNKAGVITGIRDIGKIKAKPKVGLDDTGFKINSKGILTKTKGFNKLQGKPKVGLDDAGFIRNKQGVITGVKGMGKLNAKPKADLDTSKFNNGRGKVGTGMSSMGRLTAKPKADMDHSKFDAGRSKVGTEMSSAGRLAAKPKITVDADTSGAGRARDAIAGVSGKTVTIRINTVNTYSHGAANKSGEARNATAMGGVFNYAQKRLIGEAGPEAVVPLHRALGAVDPAVRWLSAIAQGKDLPGMARGGIVGGGRTVNVGGISVVTPNSDARAVATEVVNRLVAVGY